LRGSAGVDDGAEDRREREREVERENPLNILSDPPVSVHLQLLLSA